MHETKRQTVCVQGLGFVGTAMAIAVASARSASGELLYDVLGVDLPNALGRAKVDAINAGKLPLVSNDQRLISAFDAAITSGNLSATTDVAAYARADVAIVDVHLDVDFSEPSAPNVDFTGFRRAIRTLGEQLRPGALMIVETTVPPGTCEKVVRPELEQALATRGLPPDAILLAHSYERVMPGRDYFDSIVNFWRVFAGATPTASGACQRFLSTVINVRDFPLTCLHSTTASETAKVLENSYRATNIAFIDEWGRFAEAAGVDLFAVIDAIRVRPTHNNIRQPGFGVGGYCLTKDPALGMFSARALFERSDLQFPLSALALRVNQRMPLVSLDKVRALLGGSLQSKRILVLGVSYRQDVGDTRYSPSEPFVVGLEAEGAQVVCQDPLLERWPELDRAVTTELPSARDFDAIVLTVPHDEYRSLDLTAWLGSARPLVFDANRVLDAAQIHALHGAGHRVHFIGRGN